MRAVEKMPNVYYTWDTIESIEEDVHFSLHLGTLLRAVEKLPNVIYTFGHYLEQWKIRPLFITP